MPPKRHFIHFYILRHWNALGGPTAVGAALVVLRAMCIVSTPKDVTDGGPPVRMTVFHVWRTGAGAIFMDEQIGLASPLTAVAPPVSAALGCTWAVFV